MHRRASFLPRPNKYSFFHSVNGVDMKNHWYVMNTSSFYTWYVLFTLSRSALMLPPPWSLPGFNWSHRLLQIICFYHIMLYWDILHIQLTPVRQIIYTQDSGLTSVVNALSDTWQEPKSDGLLNQWIMPGAGGTLPTVCTHVWACHWLMISRISKMGR